MRRLLIFLLLVGCGRTALLRPRDPFPDAGHLVMMLPPDAGQPHHDAGIPDAGPPQPQPWICETADAGEPGPNACERDVTAGLILSNDPVFCFVDVVPTPGEVGKLRWDCDTDAGNAEIIFARATFHGAVFGDHVTVCVGTSYEFQDNCTWLSAQHISGSLDDDAGLHFQYAEAPAPGQTGCYPACIASGPIDYDGP